VVGDSTRADVRDIAQAHRDPAVLPERAGAGEDARGDGELGRRLLADEQG
jgi:hypothetical protein